MKELTSYNRVAGYLNKVFDLLNAEFFENALSSAEAETRRTPWGLYLSLLIPSGRAGFPLELH